MKNDVGRLVWPLFLCPGGLVCRYWAAMSLALFPDATKMILGAFWARFCPSRRIYRRGRSSLFLGRFWPFPGWFLVDGEVGHARRQKIPSIGPFEGRSKGSQPPFKQGEEKRKTKDGETVGGDSWRGQNFSNRPPFRPPLRA